jgi:hypothetical protein
MDKGSETERRGREQAAPLGRAASGRLVVRPKAAHLTVRGDPAMVELYRASFEPPPPTVRVKDGTVTVHYTTVAWLSDPRRLLGRPPSGQITLNGSIPWHVRVRGGTAHTELDLGDLRLFALELGGGASHVAVNLPIPEGTVPVRIVGGVHDLTVLRPVGVAARIRIGHGASGLALDGQQLGAVGGTTRWQSPGYDQSPNRYDIAVSAGADTLISDTDRLG